MGQVGIQSIHGKFYIVAEIVLLKKCTKRTSDSAISTACNGFQQEALVLRLCFVWNENFEKKLRSN